MHRHSPILFLAALVAVAGVAAATTTAELEELERQLAAVELVPGEAIAVHSLTLRAGEAVLHLDDGTLFPTTGVGGRVAELVFLGAGRFELEPPDSIEAHQVELFTGAPRLSEAIEEGVIVIAHDGAAQAIFGRERATGVAAATVERARRLLATWRGSSERRLLNVDGALLADAVGDPAAEGYFVGWLSGGELGRFLYLVEPWAAEQVTLGSFVPLELTAKEEKKLRRRFHREQRRGRLIGQQVEDLGRWDTWSSASLRRDGAPTPGTPGFEPRHYGLEVTVDPKALEIAGRARLDLVATAGASEVVRLTMLPELRVEAVRDGEGAALPFHQAAGEVAVFLDRPPAAAAPVTVEVDYRGRAFEEVELGGRKAWSLTDTLAWYPHAGETDLATYEVTLRWPKGRELMAAGTRVAGGVEGDQRWETRQLSRKTLGFTFELGEFKTLERDVGHVHVTLAIDALSRELLRGDDALLDWIADSLSFLEEELGPLPVDALTVVSTPRGFSQATLGFITLSTLMMVDDPLFAVLGNEDPRTVIAHELSHQWWGHMVAWSGYRDQWISEALASYSAALYARQRLQDRARVWQGPTSGWEDDLFSSASSGHFVDSLGPVVLGPRLNSSLSAGAYQAIVYKKGALVLGMLARMAGEESFVKLLRWLAQQADFRVVSTELLLDAFERSMGVDLDAFARELIYGTGVPRVFYSYTVAPAAAGKWHLSATVERKKPYRFRYRVVERPGGSLDVVRERVELETKVDEVPLVVPLEIRLWDPARLKVEGKGKKAREQEEELARLGNIKQGGRIALTQPVTPLDVDLDFEVKSLKLDPDDEILALFYDLSKTTKRVVIRRAQEAAVGGDVEAARHLLLEALDTADDAGVSDSATAYRDAGVYLELARIALDQGRDADVEARLDAAKERLKKASIDDREAGKATIELLGCRLALHRGEAAEVLHRLQKRTLGAAGRADTEALLLLALAARQAGESDVLDQALKLAEPRRASVAELERLRGEEEVGAARLPPAAQ